MAVIKSEMAGTVLEVKVKAGDSIKSGQDGSSSHGQSVGKSG